MFLETLLALGALLLGAGGYFGYRQLERNAQIKMLANNQSSGLSRLAPKITWCRYLENVGDYGINLAEQYKTTLNLQKSSEEVLAQKFNVTEVTYARYRQTLEATNQILNDNLLKMIPLIETLDNIAESTLMNKQELVDKIQALYTMNAQLLEKLNALIINLSKIKSLSGPDESTTQFLIENLDKLIERAKHY